MNGYTRRLDEIGADDIPLAGGKAANLGELRRAGFPVPHGFVITTDAYRRFVAAAGIGDRILELAGSDGPADSAELDRASERIRALFAAHEMPAEIAAAAGAAYRLLRGTGGGEPAVAVRSSATAEDLADASFAGQQDTYLNIRGADELRTAVRDCWASLWTARAMAYRARQRIDPGQVSLAVVVQTMVPADAAGVMFTANPANGRRDQTVVSAAWGLGESVVSGQVSTDDVVVDTASGRVLSRHTADKRVMTGYAEHGTAEEQVPDARRREQVLDDRAVTELAGIGARIAEHYGAPQDIEWAYAGGEFRIVQSRPITALPEPTGDVPTEWPLPYPRSWYFRASIVEQLPDPLSPLFADMIDGSVARSLGALMRSVFGAGVMRPGDLGLPTVNGYAYYHYRKAAFRRMVYRMPIALAKLVTGAGDMGYRGWRDRAHPRYARLVARWAARPVSEMSEAELLAGVHELLDAGTVYYTAVQSVIPSAGISEALFARYYDRLVHRDGDPTAVTFLLGYDSLPIRAEKSLYALAEWTREHPELAAAIESTANAAMLARGDAPAGVAPALWTAWWERFDEHLARFGHVVYNLDFVAPVPADDPAPVLDTLRFYLRGQGADPSLRQSRAAAAREEGAGAARGRLGPLRRAGFTRLLRWAQRTGPAREDALADIGLAWPPMRRMLLELGGRLVKAGVLAEPSDVFWLRHDELRAQLEPSGAAPAGLTRAIEQRKMTWRGQRLASPPQMLPVVGMPRWMTRMMPSGDQGQTGNVITGVAASAGRVTAPARVLAGPEEFGQMRAGDVLVARMTTPAWTSLFAMASAVVTDVGGPLSHSSIVAREYGIPAVLGTGVATQRLTSGQQIQVDGDAGTVTPMEDADEPLRSP
ncbi:PEP/pyruvate-binding domain-containing protein [Pseudonocardia acaciae]|uniref:PEP/pyruvate-binding domain-containing protein n=1 Tax=Pseudonocardia acaciae TaxID=551276 RepID=UPI00048BF491|nr:PEP/pyruvate-binding domain-containing protein [Pseudonocardia acaciae]